ncbi:MAG: starch-binding protein [Muribaculaceae bacterium]|nr:starch-binding protein [Muribaculaceae bacterium]
MKKSTIFSAAAFLLGALSASAQYNVYVANEVGYANPHIYLWGDINDLGGGWPGIASAGTVTEDGVEYVKFIIPAEAEGKAEHLIFNNNAGDQLNDLAYTFGTETDIYTTATATGLVLGKPGTTTPVEPASNYTLYISNEVGYANPHIYLWGDVEALGGGWPGIAPSGSVIVGGIVYNKYVVPASAGQTENIIYNDDTTQLADYEFTFGSEKELYFNSFSTGLALNENPGAGETEKPDVKTHTLYVLNNTGWDTLCVYAWNGGGAPELFGGWPGASSNGTVEVDGDVYLTFEMPESASPYNFIFNNGVGGDTGQYNAFDETVPSSDLWVIASAESAQIIDAPVTVGVEEVEVAEEAEAVYFTLQGVKVQNPENGIYVKVVAGKASKVVL